MKYGVLTLVSCLSQQIMSVYCLIFSKFLNGIFQCIVQLATVKMINETVPVYLLGKYNPVVSSFIATGYLLVTTLGEGLP